MVTNVTMRNGVAVMIRWMTIAWDILIMVTHMFVRNGVAGMVGGMMGCIVIPTNRTLLMVSRTWLGVPLDGTMAAPGLTVPDILDCSLPIMPDLDGKPEVPLSGSGGPFPDDFRFSYMDTPLPDSGIRILASMEIPDLANNFDKRPGMPLFGTQGTDPQCCSVLVHGHPVAGTSRRLNPGTHENPGSHK